METQDACVKWGRRTGGGKKDESCSFYDSFTYDGVKYSLYDCVYMHKDGDEPYIGKIIKIWDSLSQPRRVRVQWFFRPTEIWWWLRQHNQKALPNELFLASGKGVGLADTNCLEAIGGKCNVVCISKDERNPQPSVEQLQGADYVFHRSFDVGECNTSEHFGDQVGLVEVKFVFNQKKSKKSEIVKEKAANDLEGQRGKKNATSNVVKPTKDLSSLDNRPTKKMKLDGSNDKCLVKDEKKSIGDILKKPTQSCIRPEGKKKIGQTEFIGQEKDVQIVEDSCMLVKDENKSIGDILKKPAPSYISLDGKKNIEQKEFIGQKKDVQTVGDSSVLGDGLLRVDECSPKAKPKRSLENLSLEEATNEEKKTKSTIDSKVACEEMLMRKKSEPLNNGSTIDSQASKDAIVEGRVIEVTRRPDDDEDRWFLLAPWEERMLASSDQGMLVILQNLDPEYTSAEVEDIIWHAFREKCNAKVVQRNAFSDPLNGEALLIFKSREAAERVVRKLNDGCLVLSDQRPLVGRLITVPKNLGKQSKFAGHLVIDKLKHQLQKDKDAVSTSHCAQPNTIEHELAMDWCLLQSRSDNWWKMLHEQHRAQLKRCIKNGLNKSK